MWKRKRWKAYSRNVQKPIPATKQGTDTAGPYAALAVMAMYVTTGSQIVGIIHLTR
jgi:hypothetical protein